MIHKAIEAAGAKKIKDCRAARITLVYDKLGINAVRDSECFGEWMIQPRGEHSRLASNKQWSFQCRLHCFHCRAVDGRPTQSLPCFSLPSYKGAGNRNLLFQDV